MSFQRSGRRVARLAYCTLAFALLPNQIGFQDLGALLARQPSVSQRWRTHLFSTPLRTIDAGLFNLPHPLGTAIPRPPLYALASVSPNEITGALGREVLGDWQGKLQFPSVNRTNKGDTLVAREREPMPPPVPMAESKLLELDTEKSANNKPDAGEGIFFGADALTASREEMSPWSRGQAPIVVAPADKTEIKLSALLPPDRPGDAGLSIAGKGEVTGPDQRPMSPAERLKIKGGERAKAEKCLANAVYFEARDEPVRAQIAVAQVVLNRVFSPFYPKTVCDVVYQNAWRHNACQFTFACDGKRDTIEEPDAWARAQKIATEILDGKLWMPDVAKSTHYHDDWAHPNWVGEMKRLDKLGGLIFYRPRNWGDGSDEPKWGDPKTTATTAAKL